MDEDKMVVDANEDEELKQYKNRRKIIIRMIAFVIAISFFLMAMNTTLQLLHLPSLDFLKISREFKEDPAIRKNREAVVLVKANDRQGTGFNIESNGFIITNAHVVENAEDIYIDFANGNKYTGYVQAIYPEVDLAMVEIQGENLPYLTLDKDQQRKEGEEVTIIGNPLGFPGVITKGKVRGLATLKDWKESVLVIEGTIHQGSSGSPVMNKEEKVIGVIFGTIQQDKEKIIGVAIPVDIIKEKLEENHGSDIT